MLYHNIALAITYVVFAKLGQSFAIEPGNVTAVWLPSGISFMWVWLKGYRVLPGVFIGAFIGNVSAYHFPAESFKLLLALGPGLMNGIGDSLCAYVGVESFRLFAHEKNILGSIRSTVVFVGLGALAGCFVSAIFGVGGLLLFGLIEKQAFINTFVTWFVGDSVGILILVPLLDNIIVQKRYQKLDLSPLKIVELIGTITIVLCLLWLGFVLSARLDYNILVFILMPVMAFLTFLFDELINNLIYLFVSVIGIYLTLTKSGFFGSLPQDLALLYTQVFVFSLGSTMYLIISAVNRIKSLSEKMTNIDRLKTLGELSAGVAHEIKNPLQVISMGTAIISDAPDVDTIEMAKKDIQSSVHRISKIVDALGRFGYNHEETKFERYSLGKIIDETINLVTPRLKKSPTQLKVGTVPDVMIESDRYELQQVLINLVSNALDELEESRDSWIEIRVELVNEQLKIIIRDSGTGINDKDVVKRLFDPFFTTKQVGKGTGLGLSISKTIMQKHRGDLTYQLIDGHTAFVLTMPRIRKS